MNRLTLGVVLLLAYGLGVLGGCLVTGWVLRRRRPSFDEVWQAAATVKHPVDESSPKARAFNRGADAVIFEIRRMGYANSEAAVRRAVEATERTLPPHKGGEHE